ncbi:unnamed protein product [Nippostrongylus brasiliensis]|uniref:Beta-galactosidase n=1 Tax=Nippostrongylus brasiliensis TaxID=27835 RepID=A0A0N4YRR2_NIPBR|nr:unnamed protein product [Nippostrongylus brasiliensis]
MKNSSPLIDSSSIDSPSFSIDFDNDRFLLDGKPFRYIAGSIHYFRIHPTQWRDRLQRVRALGFNAIQYYIPWNFHEIYEGQYDFSGGRNFTEFSRIASELGMYSLVRLGPYVCGEWENGGLPWWLLNKDITMMRTSEKNFKAVVQKWFSVLLPIIKPLLRQNGGPVLMVQIENEYGSYMACDRMYTAWLRDVVRNALGNDTVLYTTDGNSASYVKCGSVPDTLPTVDFGPTSEKNINISFAVQRKFFPNGRGPLVNSEFYPGWLVLWGQTTASIPSTENIVKSAQYMYSLGANINFYMIHGGTNFGFWNGAEITAPCITSYDYFAPISEAGDVTPKYLAIRSWVKSIPDWSTPPLDVPKNNPKTAYGEVRLVPTGDFSDVPHNSDCIVSKTPKTFEKLGQPFGFVLYARNLETCGKSLEVKELKDFGYVYMNGKHLGTFEHLFNGKSVKTVELDGCTPGDVLYILVENQGRQTYETINDYKGILSDVKLDGKVLNNWVQCKVEIADDYVDVSTADMQEPGKFGSYHGVFHVDVPTDTFLNTTGWGKGVALVNGHNLGRYWARVGPQYTLYVPAPFLKAGENSLVILELEASNNCDESSCTMSFVDQPIYTWNTTTSKADFFAGPRRTNWL